MNRAVVFAYHNVGVRCLSVLLAHDIDVALVVTHTDSPGENIWFDSVARLAQARGLPVVTPDDPNSEDFIARIRSLAPDFVFSFYYRHMLKPELLALAKRGALNMHGSLLPKYRGRVPVNWAVINGESETGATLHDMTAKPDAGDIVDQQAVPILQDDTAYDVFQKVAAAAETVLERNVRALVAGTAPRVRQDLARGGYFGGRKPADGRIDWSRTALQVHNLVRGVAPPYPGAFCDFDGATLRILRTRLETSVYIPELHPAIYTVGECCYAVCADGSTLRVLEMELAGRPFTAADLVARFGTQPLSLQATQP